MFASLHLALDKIYGSIVFCPLFIFCLRLLDIYFLFILAFRFVMSYSRGCRVVFSFLADLDLSLFVKIIFFRLFIRFLKLPRFDFPRFFC